ncbi:hypothetical protein DXV75_04190 [Alteromonas aestuariivivens]|uniref:Uncharacterized protein n=1 Tax=Alteromonas aestuariivivens TaxID=1938339 RepID=A0A3D8MCC6_9ALTE|nr:oligosaccharide flippase family protein [Alteromonas aestuariivivens]RDV28168.1 hypothetical protein DXV75_04190 [Alteromonas aestuariivivens]
MSLRAKTLSGAFFNLFSNGFTQLINFAVYAIMAQLLEVEEFGLVAICMLIVEFCSVFVTSGVNQNLIQRKTWDQGYAALAYWLLLGISGAITLILLLVGCPLVYYFYSPTACYLLAALAVIPVCNGFRLVHRAKMEREFLNKQLALFESAGIVVGGAISIFAALQGAGAWAIVYGKVAHTLLSTSLTIYRSDFHVTRVHDLADLKEMMSFIKPLLGMAIINFFSARTSNIVIAAALGPSIYAYASIAKQGFSVISNFTLQPLNRIALAGLSRVSEANLAQSYFRIVSMTALFVTPVIFGIGAISYPFVDIFFGEKWAFSAHLISILALTVPNSVLGWYLTNLLISQGHARPAFRLNIISLCANTALPILMVLLGYGVTAVFTSTVLATYITIQIRFKLVNQHLPITFRDSFRHTWPYSFSGAVMFALVLATERLNGLSHVLNVENRLLEMVMLILLGAILYTGLLALFFRQRVINTLSEFKALKRKS